MRMGLGPMEAACAKLGHPERAFEAVHVAGTNGKGSVCAMVEAVLRGEGKKTGLYTSPHLCRFAERIRVGSAPLDDATLAELLDRVIVAAPELSFFETATLAAFVAFREAKVDVGIVEVGIGGRLDATNVLPRPRACAITRIALDHTDRLGPTLEDIAREKAGIAKPGVEIVLGPIEGAPLRVIEAEARRRGATTRRAPPRKHARLGLAGPHQVQNAHVAWTLSEALGASAHGIEQGLACARWPARMERIDIAEGPLAGAWLLDAAHNPDGAAALARALTEATSASGVRGAQAGALVFGVLADKSWREMLDVLAPRAAARVYVAPPVLPGLPRAATDPHRTRVRRHACTWRPRSCRACPAPRPIRTCSPNATRAKRVRPCLWHSMPHEPAPARRS
jgi:dihydrofolate synthase/folylpolyglutamate synthase